MIIQGNSLEKLKDLQDESVDCVMTSPPYWALRDYGVDGQLGLEPTFQDYINKLCDIFDEVKRVLKKEGTCWVNMGDTYNSKISAPNSPKLGERFDEYYEKTKKMRNESVKNSGLKEKTLCQIPSRFAIEMCNRGWILRNEIIWHKPNCMPSSVKDRFTVDFEKLFFFVKSKKYYFETQYEDSIWYEKDKRAITGGITKSGKSVSEQGNQYAINKSGSFNKENGKRNMRSVWRITTKPYKEAHFATYPEALCETPIKAGCPEFVCKKCGKAREKILERTGVENKSNEQRDGNGDISGLKENTPQERIRRLSGSTYQKVERETGELTDCGCNAGWEGGIVLDPFSGAGTTGLVAQKLGRKYIGIELNPEYCKIAEARLVGGDLTLF